MALIQHSNRQLHGGEPARHFKPQTKRQRDDVLRKIDIAEAEMEITLMQREQRAGSMTPDPYRLLEFGMLTRPGDPSPDEPSPVDTIPPIFPGLDNIAASSDRRAIAMVLALYLLAVLAAAWLVFGGRQ